MRFKTAGKTGAFILTMLLLVSFINKTNETVGQKHEAGDRSAYYSGIKEKSLYSRSEIKLSDQNYTFPPVLQGDKIEHDFFIKNDSQVMIEFNKIKSCCGFILRDYTPRIFPGKEGKISIIMFTDKFGGKTVQGRISSKLINNSQKRFNLTLSVFVKKIVSVSQHKIILKGSGNQEVQGSTIIVPEPDHPFEIIGIKAKKGLHIDYDFRKTETNGGAGYLVLVKNTQKKSRVYRDTLYIQTDNPIRPEIRIRVEGHISE